MSKTIIVEAKGKKITGVVVPSTEVIAPQSSEIKTNILRGAEELIGVLSGKDTNAMKKKCSRCVKMGRMPYHDLEDFSLLKSGKRHSQCKVCRVEQADKWCKERKEHRKAYHKQYYKSRPRYVPKPKVEELPEVVEESDKVDASDALFIGVIQD